MFLIRRKRTIDYDHPMVFDVLRLTACGQFKGLLVLLFCTLV